LIIVAPHLVWNNVERELALCDPRDRLHHMLNGRAAAIRRGIAKGLLGRMGEAG
jgi:hypothetical protein